MGFDRRPIASRFLSLVILGQRVRFAAECSVVLDLLASNFEAITEPDVTVGHPDRLAYKVKAASDSATFALYCRGKQLLGAATRGDLLFGVEKSLTVELQKRRPDLYFLHAAALEWHGKAYLLAADSGSGKSTTAWALLHHGLRYLSDELSAIDLKSMRVHPYPHALCLKRRPPDYPLPAETIDLGRTLHIPVSALPAEVTTDTRPLGGVFLLKHRPELDQPELRRISPAEAGARLYLTALNALSHANRGLDAAVHIAETVPCFAIESAGLPATCVLIRSVLPN